jgi:molecular chaperone DnaJ
MPIKDYYEILEIPAGASGAMIKKAYRKLAMRYHPDKNVGNPYAAHHFQEILEAYEVLSNPVRRNEYHLKRWQYPEMGGMANESEALTPELLLQEATKLANQVKGIDIFRMNSAALNTRLEQLLNDHHLTMLKENESAQTRIQIIQVLIPVASLLPFPPYQQIHRKLLEIAGDNPEPIELLQEDFRIKKQQFLWDKYKGFLMIIIALILCYLIYRNA